MNLYNILTIIQYCCTAGLFIESWILIRKWKHKIHLYLFLNCMATLISNVGYLCEMKCATEEAYYVALKFSYAGRVWVAFTMFLFVAELCRIKLPNLLKNALVLVHLFTYILVFTIRKHDLYYVDPVFTVVTEGIFPKIFSKNGIWYNIHMVVQIAYIAIGLIWIIRAHRKEKDKVGRKRLQMVFCAIVAESACYILMMCRIPGFTAVYDTTMVGYFIGTIFMLIAIFSYDLLGTKEIAKEFVIDRISEGIIAADKGGVIRYYNEPAERLYPEIKGTNAAVPPAMLQAVREEGNLSLGERIYKPEENELVYEGKNYGKLYALVDETEHYHYMAELQEQRDIADRANEAKSRFLANMSHEIRTPINAVLGMDEMILRESPEGEIRSYAADIMSAGKTLLSLINDILDLSKVEEGKMEIIPVEYDLSSLINDLSNMIQDRAEKKGLAFRIEADSNIPHFLYGDEIRIRQCVLNLLTNAVKYTEKGSVTLSVSFEEKEEEKILLGFSVKDTGIGMKKEDLEKLFTPYQRIEEERNRAIEGTGLGMSIVRQLLGLMGSELQVKSEYGKGTEFAFCLLQEVRGREELGDISGHIRRRNAEDYVYRELFHAPEARILVVDDTEMNLTVMQSLLKKTRIQIDTAMSGKDALALAAEHSYDVVFIDHMMPDMDGIETLQRMRELEKNRSTPAVALTANAISGAREYYLEAGFSDYMSKPMDGERLEKLLQALLPEEKLLPLETSGEGRKEDPAQKTPLPEWLSELPEIDVGEGIQNCDSVESYLSVLSVFHKTADQKAEEIEKLWREGDRADYTIRVHALKSSARIIGAKALSKLAESLEKAGKEGDMSFIDENTEELLAGYRQLDQKLSTLDEKKEDRDNLPELDAASRKDAFHTMAEVAQCMDYGLMEQLLGNLREYRLSPMDEEYVSAMEKLMTELNWEEMSNTAERALLDQED